MSANASSAQRPAVWPTKDVALREPEPRRWEQTFPNHRTVILEGAGHYIQEDSPRNHHRDPRLETMTRPHAKLNLNTAKDFAPEYGMGDMGEARFVRDALGAEHIGLSQYRINPGHRIGFGHRHRKSEEVYVVLAGSGRFRVEDDIFEVSPRDVVYCPPEAMRGWEAGPDGLEMLAFGGHAENDAEMQPGWWTD